MDVIKFPSKLPAPHQLELTRAHLCGLLQQLATDVMGQANELMKADNAAAFAAVVRETAEKVAEANSGWTALSCAIRESWGI